MRLSEPLQIICSDDVVLGELMANLLDEAGYRSLTIADHDQIGEGGILAFGRLFRHDAGKRAKHATRVITLKSDDGPTHPR